MTQQNDDFISFEKALRDLDMQSEQLKRLVSEGEIRAFRDGDSMKFKREDLEALSGPAAGGVDLDDSDEELVFAESLEDDTGMVTEELSEEDTLLAEDDLEDEDDAPPPVTAGRSGGSARSVRSTGATARARQQAEEDQEATPTWVIAAVIITALIGLYGLMTIYSTATDAAHDPFELFVKSGE